MPKPFAEHPGSGMHTHLSLFEGDRNAFFEAGAPYQLCKVGRAVHRRTAAARRRDHRRHQPVGQLLQAALGRRRGAGIPDAGATTTAPPWCGCPCTSRTRGSRTRVEVRSLDAACNPYLAYAVMLAAGLKGIEEGYELPPEAEDDVWSADRGRAPGHGHRAAAGLAGRGDPGDGAAASWSPRRSGSTSSTSSCATSGAEWDDYRDQVTAFELGPLPAAASDAAELPRARRGPTLASVA